MVNKKITVILSLVILLSFWYTNNLWLYIETGNIPIVTTKDLSFENIGKTYKVNGKVIGSSIYGEDIHQYRILSSNEEIEANSTMWPSIGSYNHLSKNESVNIIGSLSKYNGIWQINTLNANFILQQKKESKPVKAVSLSDALNLQDEYVNNIGPLYLIFKEFRAKSGALNLSLLIFDSKKMVQGIMYESVWREKKLSKLIKDQPLLINAKIAEYKGSQSLQVDTIKKLENNISSNKFDLIKRKAIPFEDSFEYMDSNRTIVMGPFVSFSTNITRSGEHLQFEVKQGNDIVPGIMFNFDKQSENILNGSEQFYIIGKVTEYRNKYSFQASWVIADK